MGAKELVWVGSTLERVRGFPSDTRQVAGYQLYLVQLGLNPTDWRPMPSVGGGVVEIRLHVEGEYRILYVAKYEDAVYVLHAFEKKTQQTRKSDLDLARRNLVEVLHRRREG
jgi:phage-related protein